MKFAIKKHNASRNDASAFTLAEVLAALLFMAIVIPVAMQGLRISSRAGELADRKREVSDRDLEAIVSEQVQLQDEARFLLKRVQVSCGTGLLPTATVTLETKEGGEHSQAAIGTGPVDAVCQALNQLALVPNELVEFAVKSVTEGIDAMGEVTSRLRRDGVLYSGHAADTDIVVAAAQAFVNALNRLVAGEQRAPLPPQNTPLPLAELPRL